MADKKPITEEYRNCLERHEPAFRPYWDAADEEDAFLDGDRYEVDHDYHNRDRRLVQIKGKETEDGIQHDVAVWNLKPRNLQARPIDRIGDPVSAEFMASLMQYELSRADKGFDEELYKAIMASMEHRYGIVWFDWHPDCGKWGEIIPIEEDFRRYMWDPAHSPHHILSAWVHRSHRIYVEEAREMYSAPWLEPDRMSQTKHGRPDKPLLSSPTAMNQDYEDDKVTIWQWWKKKDKTYKSRAKKDSKDQILAPEDRYMSCAGNCGYRSPRQSDMGQELPEAIEQACPTCGGNLERIDSLGEQETIYAYKNGKRLVIMAPFSPKDDKPLYDGDWPIPRCRSYPGIFIPFKVRSGRLMGGSKVSWGWDTQMAVDQIKTMLVQQVFESQPLYIMPKRGLYDRDNRRFERRDDQGNTAFRDDSDQFLKPNPIERIEGGGIDPNAFGVLNALENTLAVGKADLGLTDESSKDIAASSIAQQVKQEELPNADFFKRTAGYIAQGLNVFGDMIIATYPPARLARLNLEGTDEVMEVWGQDLPGMDVEIEVSPEFTGLEKTRVESLKALDEIYARYMAQGLPPEAISPIVEVFAKEMHFAPSTVREFQKAMLTLGQAQMELARKAAEEEALNKQTMEDEAAADLEAGIEVPGMAIGAPEEGFSESGMVPGQA